MTHDSNDPHSATNGDRLLTVVDVARMLNVSHHTVYRWCQEGTLPCLKLGHLVRVRPADLDAWMESQTHA